MKQRAKRPGRSPQAELQASIRQLRKAYATGKAIGKQFAVGGEGNQAGIMKEAQRRHYSDDVMRKMRQLADPEVGFSPDQLDEYVALMKRYHRPAGFGFAIKLLTIPNKNKRMAVARKAIKEGWTLSDLRTYVLAEFGHRKHGGRRPKIPRTVPGLLEDLRKRAAAWQRLRQVLEEETNGEEDQVHWDDLPADVRDHVKRIADAAAKLQGVVNKRLRRSASSRCSR